ncbi:MAG: sigma-70 family RNA polymerase sigma factor [Prevotellaceae bacterium]|nr:sigma-70 family RNA polymerase sigma factor [Candidatus Minthosoma equi]
MIMRYNNKFTQIVKENKTAIYTVCYMFSKDKEEVEDLFQDTLINLWNGFEKFKGESSVSTWVWRVALNTCISTDRKRRRQGQKIPLQMNIDLYSDNDDASVQVQILHKRIGSLGVIDRAIILLWLEGMSYDEIGAIIGITAQNVGVKLYRIKEQLKKMK